GYAFVDTTVSDSERLASVLRVGSASGIGYIFFFFQAEDGIRDWSVTGVQTCALPISRRRPRNRRAVHNLRHRQARGRALVRRREIGRASCRERVEISVVAGSLKKKKGQQERKT